MNYVNTQIIAQGSVIFDTPVAKAIPCGDTEVIGTEWFIPVIENGMFSGNYSRIINGSNTPPQADAFKTLRLHTLLDRQDIWILLENTGSETTFTSLCNLCCDATSYDMPIVTIPAPIIEVYPCPVAPAGTNSYTFFSILPAQNGFNLTATFTANGVVIGTLPTAAGYTTPALLLAAAITAWGAYGTWTLQNSNTMLRLVSTTVTHGGIQTRLVAKTFCYDILANNGDIVNEVVIGGVVTAIPQLTINATGNPMAIYFALQSYLPGLVYTEDSGDSDHPYLQFTGTIAPQSVRNSGAVTGTFTVGVCF